MEALSAPNPELAIELPPQWVAFLEKEEQEKQAKKEAQKAAAEAAKAAAAKAKAEKKAAAPAAASAGGGYVDWSGVPARDITLFYPGEASIEWTLGGKHDSGKHGGGRAFQSGDRCVDCHDEETADMGQKMVTGEKLEPNVIAGKRAAIPVSVKAAHDADNLYLRFEWPDATEASGDKMDPTNRIKIAFMLSTDEVEYADRAGCWGTCHADADSMPFDPEGQEVTKYLTESRTKIEVKGRRGKAMGGWDKRKSDDEINAELDAGRFMDIVRYKVDEQKVENGAILADRLMDEKPISIANAQLQDGVWVVEFKRPLKSDNKGDVSLDLGQTYNFGFAIHDDYTNARYHHVSLGYKLGFDNFDVEVNAVQAEALAPQAAAPAAATAPAAAAAAGGASDVDWAAVPVRDITLFYPGEASIEWTLGGKHDSGKHGGGRAFQSGDRCADCHDEETADMGQKMVTGEKLEPNVIAGKRGAIPVGVQASHDGENLYLRFKWEDTSESSGDKMDPANRIKIAFMLSTDAVEYADRAGCWGTCHADADSMPFDPEGQEVTKYLTESRTKIEVKGRRGKAMGGWDKRKSDDEIKAELEAGRFMDIVRYKVDEQKLENGAILADRLMDETPISTANAQLQDGFWVVDFKRPLKSDNAGDVSLDLGQTYNFGFAIHDDYTNARYHHVSLGYKLGFDNFDVEVNAVGM